MAKGRIGTKHYDTDKATLIDTLDDGVQVYRKTGRSTEFYLYNPSGTTAKTRFFDLPAEQAVQYLDEDVTDKKVYRSGVNIQFSQHDKNRIMRLATLNGMSMPAFLLMLVDEYERTHKCNQEERSMK